MFNGIRKIVGGLGSSDNLDESYSMTDVQTTPCLNKSKKRKAAEGGGFSSKKKFVSYYNTTFKVDLVSLKFQF